MPSHARHPDQRAGVALDAPLLIIKLLPPPLRNGLVPRPQLMRALEQASAGALTLVIAPAGYGKTTLLSAWAASRSAQRSLVRAEVSDVESTQHGPVAWLTLDRDANEPARFWACLTAALQLVYPALAASPEPSSAALVALLNQLADFPDTLALVLDDYHTIDDARIHRGMAFVMDHLPRTLRLVIASRALPLLPLDRLRARGQLVELGADILRCTEAEATTFLRATMGLPITTPEIGVLTARTEGWFAGLQLAALALRGQPDLPGAARAVAGTQRLIAGYLLDEVLGQQSPKIQAFLLRTSILDRLCGPLCDAVLGDGRFELSDRTLLAHAPIADFTSREILEELERANLFLVPLDGERRWYRYHQLFAEMLRDQLARRIPGLAPTLHRRAAAWYAAQGLLPEAIEHALAASDDPQAADLIARVADTMWLRGELATLGHWLDALPKMLVLQQPILVLMRFWTLLNGGQVHAAAGALADTEQRLSPHTSARATDTASGHPRAMVATQDELAVLLTTLRVLLAFAQEQPPLALPDLDDDLACWHWLTVLHVGFAAWTSGALTLARRALTQALRRPQAAADGTQRLLALFYLADLDPAGRAPGAGRRWLPAAAGRPGGCGPAAPTGAELCAAGAGDGRI